MITEAYAGSCSSPIHAVPPEVEDRPSMLLLFLVILLAGAGILFFSSRRSKA